MDIAAKKQVLLSRRAELTGHLTVIEHDLDETPPKDWEDRSSERQGDEVLEALGHAELGEVARIDTALMRVSDGTFGSCQKCGKLISDARLDLLPDTPFCRQCAL